MKLKRAKAYKKLMGYMHMNFGFREPYQVLCDEEVIIECSRMKMDLVAALERTVQGKVKPMVTQCTMEHLYRSKNAGAIDLAKTFERRRCGHIPDKDETVSAFECLCSVVDVNGSNKHRYVLATQKPKLRQRLRKVPGVPLIYVNRAVMIMEPMSPATERARSQIEAAKLSQGLNAVKDGHADEATPRKRKGAKEPNPLSVKKRKLPEDTEAEPTEKKTRRKRGKKRSETDQPAETGAETVAESTAETVPTEAKDDQEKSDPKELSTEA